MLKNAIYTNPVGNFHTKPSCLFCPVVNTTVYVWEEDSNLFMSGQNSFKAFILVFSDNGMLLQLQKMQSLFLKYKIDEAK